MSLSLHDYGVGYDESSFYDALYHYYADVVNDDKEFVDFDFDDYNSRKSLNGKTIYDWLADPHPKRGDISVELTSPQGTTSIMLPYRKYDFINEEGYDSWPFMSVHNWGEDPSGEWTVTVLFKSSSGNVLVEVENLILYGTSTIPTAVAAIPSQCDPTCASGCGGTGSDMCDACIGVRNASTLQCTASCGNNDTEYNGYCVSSYSSGSPSISCYNSIIIPIAVLFGILLLFVGCLVVCISCCCWTRKRTGSYKYSVQADEGLNSYSDGED